MTGAPHPAPAATAPQADQGYVTRLTRRSHTNFYYAFLFLPRPRREAIHALYAFCRQVDDSVDASTDPEEAVRRVAFWRRELAAAYEATPTHPVTRALASHLRVYPIRERDLEDVIDGVAMDLEPRRYATWEELRVYCHRVASAVGLACIEIFGYRNARARDYAMTLGLAFQMTNILRDVRSDAVRGRIYLPADTMARHGCHDGDLRATAATEAFRSLMRAECARTRALFEEARRLLPRRDRRSLCAASIMGGIYEAILDKIDRRVDRVLVERTALSRPRKFALAAGLYLRSMAGGA